MIRSVGLALAAEGIVIAGLLLVVADQVAHTRVERLGGVNIWGYRGPVLKQKRANEVRLAVVGGDLAFSWGVAASQTLAQSIRDQVAFDVDQPRGTRVVTAVTLAALGLPPSLYASWIDRYAALRFDVLLIVMDPRQHQPVASSYLPARRSAVFKTFGYSPILPLVLEERGALRHSPASRLTGRALAFADGLIASDDAAAATTASAQSYVDAAEAAVRSGVRAAARGVVVVTPAGSAAESLDAQGVKALVALRFPAAPVAVVDLSADPSMQADTVRLDGFNLSTAGHAVAASAIAPAVVRLLAAPASAR